MVISGDPNRTIVTSRKRRIAGEKEKKAPLKESTTIAVDRRSILANKPFKYGTDRVGLRPNSASSRDLFALSDTGLSERKSQKPDRRFRKSLFRIALLRVAERMGFEPMIRL